MFFTNFEKLCSKIGKTPTAVGNDLGIPKTTISYWRNTPNAAPKQDVIVKIAAYFNVTVDYLLNENKPLVNENEELTEYLQELQSRDEMRALFKITKNCTKEEVEQAVRVIEALRKGN